MHAPSAKTVSTVLLTAVAGVLGAVALAQLPALTGQMLPPSGSAPAPAAQMSGFANGQSASASSVSACVPKTETCVGVGYSTAFFACGDAKAKARAIVLRCLTAAQAACAAGFTPDPLPSQGSITIDSTSGGFWGCTAGASAVWTCLCPAPPPPLPPVEDSCGGRDANSCFGGACPAGMHCGQTRTGCECRPN